MAAGICCRVGPRTFRPHAQRRNRLPDPSTEEPGNDSSALNPGKASLVREPLASTTEKLREPERDELLFMLAARWADHIRTRDRAQHRGPWHYVDFPFKLEGEPEIIETKPQYGL